MNFLIDEMYNSLMLKLLKMYFSRIGQHILGEGRGWGGGGGSSFCVGWMRGTLVCNNSLSTHKCKHNLKS